MCCGFGTTLMILSDKNEIKYILIWHDGLVYVEYELHKLIANAFVFIME